MNLNQTVAPPINNLCVPDIYNRLDAEVIERTRVVNNLLTMRLNLEQKVISKYKQEAERSLLLEKSRVSRDLSRILRPLPAVTCLRDFDEKFRRLRFDPQSQQEAKGKNYFSERRLNARCQRCYIHHLPGKQIFYRKGTPPAPPLMFDSLPAQRIGSRGHKDKQLKESGSDIIQSHSLRRGNEEEHLTELAATGNIPSSGEFKFLEEDKYGCEEGVHHSLAPRLMPNEMWKNIVTNLRNECLKHEHLQGQDSGNPRDSLENRLEERGPNLREALSDPRPVMSTWDNAISTFHSRLTITTQNKSQSDTNS